MTKETVLKLYAHFCNLAEGNVENVTSGEVSVEKVPTARMELIKVDAKRAKEKIEQKHPFVLDNVTKVEKKKDKKVE